MGRFEESAGIFCSHFRLQAYVVKWIGFILVLPSFQYAGIFSLEIHSNMHHESSPWQSSPGKHYHQIFLFLYSEATCSINWSKSPTFYCDYFINFNIMALLHLIGKSKWIHSHENVTNMRPAKALKPCSVTLCWCHYWSVKASCFLLQITSDVNSFLKYVEIVSSQPMGQEGIDLQRKHWSL